MAVTFRVKPHSVKSGVQVAEILIDGGMVATIYPDGEKGIKLVSAHMEEVVQDDGSTSLPPVPHVFIRFDPQPYAIEGGRIVKHPTTQE